MSAALDVKDLRFDTYRGDGSCVKVVHLPTGVEVHKDASVIGELRAREEAIHELKKKLAEQNQAGDQVTEQGLPEGYTSARRLCDDDGIVGQVLADSQPLGDNFLTYRGLHNRLAALSGREPITEDFSCTGSAHYATEHVYCTSPAHCEPESPAQGDVRTRLPIEGTG